MNNAILVAIAALIYFMFGKKAAASVDLPSGTPPAPSGGTGSPGSSTPRTGATGMTYTGPIPGYGRVNPMNRDEVLKAWDEARADLEKDWPMGEAILQGNRAKFDAHPAPMPPLLVAVAMARESGGRDQPAGPPLQTGDREEGYMQLTQSEVSAAGGGNPHDMKDSIRMSQRLYQQAINRYPAILTNGRDEAMAGLMSRSIGQGAFRWLLSRIPAGDGYLIERIEGWLRDNPERPVGIRQTDRKFARRIIRAMLRADRAVDAGVVSVTSELPRIA